MKAEKLSEKFKRYKIEQIKKGLEPTLAGFSEILGTSYQQAQRYLEYECIIVDGVIYKPAIKIK